MGVGTVALSQLQKSKLENSKVHRTDQEQRAAESFSFDIEKELAKMEASGVWDNFENKRIERPEGSAPYGTRSQRLKEMSEEAKRNIG